MSKYKKIKRFEPGRKVFHPEKNIAATVTRYLSFQANDYVVSIAWEEQGKITTGKFPESTLKEYIAPPRDMG